MAAISVSIVVSETPRAQAVRKIAPPRGLLPTAVAEERGTIRFGPFCVDRKTQRLVRDGVRVKLPRQSFLILEMLLARPGEAEIRNELRVPLAFRDLRLLRPRTQ